MKIRSVRLNNRRRAFEVSASRREFQFPYARVKPAPTTTDPAVAVWVDLELGREGFGYRLTSGREGAVHIEQVLEYHQDPGYMRNLLVYKLTIEAQKRVASSPLARREIIRRLGTSPAQFCRLLDPTNYRKSVDKLLFLLQALDCDVDVVIRAKRTA